MGNSLPVLGWILIIFLVVFIVSINIGLFMGMKKRDDKENWARKLYAASQMLKDPFQNENSKIQELALKVQQLQKNNDRLVDDSTEKRHTGDF